MSQILPGIESRLRSLPGELRDHVARARVLGADLAELHGGDAAKVDLALAVHDLARALDPDRMVDEARRLGVEAHAVAWSNPLLLHGAVAAGWSRELGLTDPELIEAVEWHTTGRRGMGHTARLVFLADKLDPKKVERYPDLAGVLDIARDDVDAAILEYLSRSLVYHIKRGAPVLPESLELRNELLLSGEADDEG